MQFKEYLVVVKGSLPARAPPDTLPRSIGSESGMFSAKTPSCQTFRPFPQAEPNEPGPSPATARAEMTTILIVLLVLVLLGAIPAWPHSRGWGYGPSGLIGL